MTQFFPVPGCRLVRVARTYGTIVVDLERHRPIDLLPDRSAETWAAWLRHEPQIRHVARDRSTEYARGTTLGAPAAVQVADRWHLLLNTRQMIERWLTRVHSRLKLLPPITAPAPSARRTGAYPRAPAEALARAAAVGRWERLYDDVRRRRAAGESLRQINREAAPSSSTPLPSPKRLSWHLLREPDDLDADAAALAARVLQDQEAARVIDLGRRFCRIVRGGSSVRAEPDIIAVFDAWLSDARACGVRVVESFPASLGQDGAAVRAGLCLPWSSGQAEGQVNRLKLLKRAMYGRAKLDLLRRRFLLAA